MAEVRHFGLLAAEIVSLVGGTPANFNGFRVLAALLHGTVLMASAKLCGVEQRAPPIFGMAAIMLSIAHILVKNELIIVTLNIQDVVREFAKSQGVRVRS